MNTQQILQLTAVVTNLIATAARNVDTSGSVSKYLDILAAIVGAAAPAYNQLVELKSLVERMVLEGREPTENEWQAVFLRSQQANTVIENWQDDGEVSPEI